MANPNKRSKRRRNNRSRKTLSSTVARLYSGIPKTGSTSTDPPRIATHMDYSIRTRFNIRYEPGNTSINYFSILLPPNAWATGGISRYKGNPPVTLSNLYLDKEDVYDSATMRAFGLYFKDASPGSVNESLKAETEFAISSVTLWGPVASNEYQPITLLVDLSDGTPGAAVSDTGDKNRRAVCKITASRLNWEKYGTKSLTEGFAVMKMAVPTHVEAPGYYDIGVVDVVVKMRRSFYAVVDATGRMEVSA